MAMIELVDFNELYNGGKKEEKKSKAVVVEKQKAQLQLLLPKSCCTGC
jgi:large subunit ribosomal protein L17